MRWGLFLLLVSGLGACRPAVILDVGPSGNSGEPEASPPDGGTNPDALPTLTVTDDNIDGFSSFIVVPGHLIVSNTSLDALNLFDLRAVAGDFIVKSNVDLSVMNLSDLESVGGRFIVEDNAALGSINVPSLQSTGALRVDGNPALSFFAAGVLESVDGDLRWTSAGPIALTFPTLGAVGSFHLGAGIFGDADTVETLTLSALVVVNGGFEVSEATALQTLRAPFLSLVAGPLVIAENPALESVDLPNLARVEGAVCLCENTTWATCAVQATLDGVDLPSGPPDTAGNDEAAVCEG